MAFNVPTYQLVIPGHSKKSELVLSRQFKMVVSYLILFCDSWVYHSVNYFFFLLKDYWLNKSSKDET